MPSSRLVCARPPPRVEMRGSCAAVGGGLDADFPLRSNPTQRLCLPTFPRDSPPPPPPPPPWLALRSGVGGVVGGRGPPARISRPCVSFLGHPHPSPSIPTHSDTTPPSITPTPTPTPHPHPTSIPPTVVSSDGSFQRPPSARGSRAGIEAAWLEDELTAAKEEEWQER